MKTCLTSLVTQEMHIKITRRYYNISTSMLIMIIKRLICTNASKDVEKLSYFDIGNVNGAMIWGKKLGAVSQKLNIELPYTMGNSIPRYMPKKMKIQIYTQMYIEMFIALLFLPAKK